MMIRSFQADTARRRQADGVGVVNLHHAVGQQIAAHADDLQHQLLRRVAAPLGGGKAVIIGDPVKDKNKARLLAFADAVNALGGRYITAMDVGIKPADMPIIARGTKFIAGYDQPGKTGGDSGPLTALGVFVGLKAAVKHRLGLDSTKGLTVAIQGLGKVGMGVAKRLYEEEAKLIVADVNDDLVRRAVDAFDARIASPDDIVSVECDVLSPNALGAILNEKTIPTLHARVIAGGANNQLSHDADGVALTERGVLYAPDYVVNGGGIIRVAGQIQNWDNAEIERRVLAIAERQPLTVHQDAYAPLPRRSDRIAKAGNKSRIRLAAEPVPRRRGLARPAPRHRLWSGHNVRRHRRQSPHRGGTAWSARRPNPVCCLTCPSHARLGLRIRFQAPTSRQEFSARGRSSWKPR